MIITIIFVLMIIIGLIANKIDKYGLYSVGVGGKNEIYSNY